VRRLRAPCDRATIAGMKVTKRLRISGRVQGVGFRASLADEARLRGLAGWVRNRSDGTVEALVHGDARECDALLAWARRGPRAARVDRVEVEEAAEAGVPAYFEQRPTA
jgi:acylphosphatase